MPGDFLDSNVLVYAFTEDPRTVTARALLARGCTISIQGLNEFSNVARRKLGKSWQDIRYSGLFDDALLSQFLVPAAPFDC